METGALPIELLPSAARKWYPDAGSGMAGPYNRRVHRRALGLLFSVLAAGLVAIAVLSAFEGGRAWVIALSAAALGVWMGSLALRALRRT